MKIIRFGERESESGGTSNRGFAPWLSSRLIRFGAKSSLQRIAWFWYAINLSSSSLLGLYPHRVMVGYGPIGLGTSSQQLLRFKPLCSSPASLRGAVGFRPGW